MRSDLPFATASLRYSVFLANAFGSDPAGVGSPLVLDNSVMANSSMAAAGLVAAGGAERVLVPATPAYSSSVISVTNAPGKRGLRRPLAALASALVAKKPTRTK